MGNRPKTPATRPVAFVSCKTAIALLLACGCSHSFADRAARYAELSGQTAQTLKPLTALAHRTCQQSRRAEFLQQRLLRLKLESLGQPEEPEYYIDGARWSEKAASTSSGLSWRDYCGAMDQSAVAFAAGLTALKAHADAVGAMAIQGQAYHPDFGALTSGAEALEKGIIKQDSPWLKLIPPLTNPIKELAHLWLAEQNQETLGKLLVRAEPIVAQLTAALQQYLDAITGQLTTLGSRQSTLIQSLEQNGGFGAHKESVRAMRCRSSEPGAAPEAPGVAESCERSRLQQRQLDALVLLLLHENAETINSTTAADLSTVAQFKDILQAFSSSNSALGRLAQGDDDAALHQASQNLQQLADVLQNVQAAANERSMLR